MQRRTFLVNSAIAGALGLSSPLLSRNASSQERIKRVPGSRLKLSCNLYSFNKPLTNGEMTLEEVLEFCARAGFDAVDPTGYYFPGYPKVPPDDYIFKIKRLAFVLGLDISGTGCRNDFTEPDALKREADVELVKSWVECAARMGAPNLRVFSGKGVPPGHSEDEAAGWIAAALKGCVEHGKRHGVMISIQNHYDFIRTPDQLLDLLRRVNSEWLGVNLDIGSFRNGDPYEEVARVAPYAITWQIKESVYVRGRETKTDVRKIVRIARDAGYRGYLPIETLGESDPKIKVPAFLDEVRNAIG